MKQRIRLMLPGCLLASLLLILHYGCSSTKEVGTPVTQEDVRLAIQNDKWMFTPINASPMSGRSRNVSTGYWVRFSKDTMTVNLPYFGTAYAGAGYPNTQNVLDFRTTGFTIEKEQDKNQGWVVTVKPKDYTEVQAMIFTLFESGSANLNITLTNRSAISYTGNVRPR